MTKDSHNIVFNDLNRKAFTNGTQRFQEEMRVQSNNFYLANRPGGGVVTPIPNTISGLILWYDFGDPASYSFTEGNVIANITDKSGTANHGTGTASIDSTGTIFPLNCAASPWDFSFPNTFNAGGKTIFAVAYTDFSGVSGGFAALIFVNDNTAIGTTGHGVEVITSGSDTRMQVYDGVSGVFSPLGSVTVAKHQFTYQLINPAASMVLRQDAAVMASNLIANGTFSLVCNRVGAQAVNAATYPQGNNTRMADLLVYNRILNGTEITAVEAYLKAKWGTP
jgi:hypothetical protein